MAVAGARERGRGWRWWPEPRERVTAVVGAEAPVVRARERRDGVAAWPSEAEEGSGAWRSRRERRVAEPRR